ncbi:sorting nexin-8 isoform X10 [Ovis canadensis]|uniref:sorting nexin-8 isoform X10 n=1 Tax=Ovis canadensis TaxID=37174 RepID=UPI0037510F14
MRRLSRNASSPGDVKQFGVAGCGGRSGLSLQVQGQPECFLQDSPTGRHHGVSQPRCLRLAAGLVRGCGDFVNIRRPVEGGGVVEEKHNTNQKKHLKKKTKLGKLKPRDSPVPPVSEPRAPDAGRMQVPPGNPLLLSLTLQELLARDAVQVELVPEKKGLFLKHVEYEVSSQRFESCVRRRYNDFVVFHEALLHKFPYRMVPALPPKRMLGADREFIEARRRALKRFINLVARHPPFSEDAVLKLFLSFSGPGKQEENDVVEKLNLFLDLLQSYRDLCERHEKGVLHKYSLMKRQMVSAAARSRGPESVEQLESRIVEQESVIQTMELRNYYSLYCLHQETQLVHAYLPLTSHILGAFVNSQVQGHKEMSKVWNDLQPKLRCLFVGPHSAPAPPRPPQDGPSAH